MGRVLDTPADVLLFWFGEEVLQREAHAMESVAYIDSKMGIWFAGKSKEFDEVQKEHTDLVHRAGQKLLTDPVWETPQGYLARVLLLDQFTRCIYRGSPLAFQYDPLVASLVKHILENDLLPFFSSIERFFLGVAIQHSEDLSLQRLGVTLGRNLQTRTQAESSNKVPEEVTSYFAAIKGYPMEHHDVIQQFGRFPSRNLALVSISLFIILPKLFIFVVTKILLLFKHS